MDVNEGAPAGARIRRADGSAIECDVARNQRGNWRGHPAWTATARERAHLDYDRDRFECDAVPPGVVISFVVPLLPDDSLAEGETGVVYESDFACMEGGTGLTWPTKPQSLPASRA